MENLKVNRAEWDAAEQVFGDWSRVIDEELDQCAYWISQAIDAFGGEEGTVFSANLQELAADIRMVSGLAQQETEEWQRILENALDTISSMDGD